MQGWTANKSVPFKVWYTVLPDRGYFSLRAFCSSRLDAKCKENCNFFSYRPLRALTEQVRQKELFQREQENHMKKNTLASTPVWVDTFRRLLSPPISSQVDKNMSFLCHLPQIHQKQQTICLSSNVDVSISCKSVASGWQIDMVGRIVNCLQRGCVFVSGEYL